MPIAFFVSSVGDTELAKETIATMIKNGCEEKIFIIPLTQTADSRFANLGSNSNKIDLFKERSDKSTLLEIEKFVAENGINCAYIGVASSNAEFPYQIASSIKSNVFCAIAYEYMFKPDSKHGIWKYTTLLSDPENMVVAVPLESAKEDFPDANTAVVSHLSIDDAFDNAACENTTETLNVLGINESDQFVFVSGTTQDTSVDNHFLDALLSELNTGKYPTIQIRFGLHPGVLSDPDRYAKYLETLLKTCEKYENVANHFKIIIPSDPKPKIDISPYTSFILPIDVSDERVKDIGKKAANAAKKVAQAVPGALLNTAALRGKPVYYHSHNPSDPIKPYLPASWFSHDLPTFFGASAQAVARTRANLGFGAETKKCPQKMAELMTLINKPR